MIELYSGINMYISLEDGISNSLFKSIDEELLKQDYYLNIRISKDEKEFKLDSEYYLDITLRTQDMQKAMKAARSVAKLLSKEVFLQQCKDGIKCGIVEICKDGEAVYII